MKQYKEPQVQTEEVVKFTHRQLHDALLWIEDKLQRSQIPFVVLGDIAQSIKNEEVPQLHGEKVEIGVRSKDLTRSGKSILAMVTKDKVEEVEGKIYLSYQKVPIEITIISKDYDFMKNPESKFYYLTELRLPNPFNKYKEFEGDLE